MTKKEKAVRGFAKAMRDADLMHMATCGTFTLNMAAFWEMYKEACMEEIRNAESTRRHNN